MKTIWLTSICLAHVCISMTAWAAENGHPVSMWQVEGIENSVYLLGSVHLLREEDHPIPSAIYDAYADAETLIMELDLDDADPLADQQLATELGLIQDGKLLRDLMGPALYAKAEALASEVNIPLNLLEKSEPWYAALNVELMMQMRLGFQPNYGIEYHLSQMAKSDSKEILGLESTRQQLGFLDNLSSEAQRDMLMQALTESGDLEDVMDQLVAAWRNGDTEYLESSVLTEMQAHAELHQVIVVNRNKDWVEQIQALLDDNDDYLVVVGTLHLVGEEGVPRLLSKHGYTVTQMQQLAD